MNLQRLSNYPIYTIAFAGIKTCCAHTHWYLTQIRSSSAQTVYLINDRFDVIVLINNRKIYYQRFLSLILNIESMDWKKKYINVKIILKYFFPVKHYLPRNTQGLIAIVVWNISVYLYTSKEICIFMCTYIHMYLVDTPDLDNLKSSDLERHSITIWKWSRSCISTVLFRMNIQFAVESDFPWRERMSSRRHRVSTKRLCACVYTFMPHIREKRRDTCERERMDR